MARKPGSETKTKWTGTEELHGQEAAQNQRSKTQEPLTSVTWAHCCG